MTQKSPSDEYFVLSKLSGFTSAGWRIVGVFHSLDEAKKAAHKENWESRKGWGPVKKVKVLRSVFTE